MKKIYCIPGLAFDHRIFQKLQLPGFQLLPLPYLEPLKAESIQSYARRMAESVEPQEEPLLFIGHSFGGIMAQEIASFRKVKKIILISSLKSDREIPNHFKLIRRLGLSMFFNRKLTLTSFPFWAAQHGYDSPELQTLFVDMVKQHSDHYLKWALRQLSTWTSPSPDCPIIHLHGTNDKTLPFKYIEAPVDGINEAGHFMVYSKADLLSEKIFLWISNN